MSHPGQPPSIQGLLAKAEASAYIQRQDDELRQFAASLKWSAKSHQITASEPSLVGLAHQPLIALFSGASPGNRPTAAPIREVPVHTVLIELGLLDYIEDLKALNLRQELFPGIGINAEGNAWGH